MEKFNDPNALTKEMDFYTSEEFQKFVPKSNPKDSIPYKPL